MYINCIRHNYNSTDHEFNMQGDILVQAVPPSLQSQPEGSQVGALPALRLPFFAA